PPSIKPPQHFGFSTAALAALKNLLASHKVWVYHFGNPYALTEINVDAALALIMAYQPLKALQEAAANHFINETVLTGQLPVAITGI
ncbi:MAG: hypothetical protein RLZZ241_1232, partial [Bacteroidota bacterium]